MIPSFNGSGVLPPFMPGNEPTSSAAMAPYRTTIEDIVAGFSGTPERVAILNGLLDFRENMRNAGIEDGWLWG